MLSYAAYFFCLVGFLYFDHKGDTYHSLAFVGFAILARTFILAEMIMEKNNEQESE